MGRGKKITKKPEWFDLKKYNSLSELSANDWAYQLHHRAYLMECFSSELEEWCTTDEVVLKLITKCPILSKNDDFFLEANKRFFAKSNNEHSNLFQSHLVPLTCKRAHELILSLSNEMKLAFKSEENINSTSFFNVPVDNADGMRRATRTGEINLCIDLNAHNDELIKEFTNYLEVARELYNFPEGSNIKNKTLKRLDETKVLPYIDLILWEKQTFSYIPQNTIGAWLFPDEFNVDLGEKIRRVTIPFATRALNYNFISTLSTLEI